MPVGTCLHQEPKKKRQHLQRITVETSPNTKKAIEETRRERKREHSRVWHHQFVSKGVSEIFITLFVFVKVWSPMSVGFLLGLPMSRGFSLGRTKTRDCVNLGCERFS